MQHFFGWMSQVILALALPYFAISLLLGIRVARRNGARLDSQERAADPQEKTISPAGLYFLIPCLNEELVIGATVQRLLAERDAIVIVIDDGSTDQTAARARSAAAACDQNERLVILTRSGPHSRQGKGAALNAAYPTVVADVATRGLDPNDVIVAVMDADGRLSAGAVNAALTLFTDTRVGGVQLIVRIRNRRKLIAQFQDIEFWMISALSQFARSISGTVSLGGNGQFTRLSALQQLTGEPWSRSLTEDLDLGLRLITAGWRVTTTTRAYVDQQAVDTLPRLLRQRTRWYQGHMDSIRRLPDLWRSNNVNEVAILEVTSYLLVPWLIVLPWSILQQWIIYQIFTGSGQGIFATGLGGLSWQVTYGLLWYVLSFAPNLMIGFIYARRTRAVTLRRALVLGHLMIAWNYIGYVAAWRALIRLARGRTNWTKTTRTNEAAEPVFDHARAGAGGRAPASSIRVVDGVVHSAVPARAAAGRHRDPRSTQRDHRIRHRARHRRSTQGIGHPSPINALVPSRPGVDDPARAARAFDRREEQTCHASR
jgi:1,2-diacylglycerol 3-beta-glucosyltransferase